MCDVNREPGGRIGGMSIDRVTTVAQAVTPPGAVGDAPPPSGGRYEVLEQVGRGGMGVVFKARHAELDRLVALKLTLPGVSVERFKREAKLLARVSSPRVVAVHDFEALPDGRHLLAMEWVDGTDLARRIRGGPLTEAEALPIMRAVAEGMSAAADAGVTHRDLKPSNILLDARGARVCDFGLASSTDLTQIVLTASGGVMGTPHYMAPEQAESPRLADTRADVYAFGATFYHALCGVPPFDRESVFGILFKHKTEPLAAPQARVPGLSDRTAAVLERCLAKNPADRFQSFAELLRHLQPEPAGGDVWADDADPRLAGHLGRYQERRPVYLAERPVGLADDYELPDNRVLRVVVGDITAQQPAPVGPDDERLGVLAVVSSDNCYLSMSEGVSQAIFRAAGTAYMTAELTKFAIVRPGRVVVSGGGKLAAAFVFHAVTLANWKRSTVVPTRDLIREILHGCVCHADTLDVDTLAVPLLGTGAGGFAEDVCLDTLFQFWMRTLLRGATGLRDVRIVLFR
jgi:eukaryotic-like serine/threonine-protein kinase